MNIVRLILFLRVLYLVQSFEIEKVLDQVFNEVQPNRVTIYTDSKNVSLNDENVCQRSFKYAVTHVPTIAIDLNSPPRLLKWNEEIQYDKNITSALHILFFSESNLIKLKQKFRVSLELIWQSIFYLTQTKIFIVINQKNFPDEELNSFFKLSFDYNFYDFTVLCLADSAFFHYNPFSKSLTMILYSEDSSIILFPDIYRNISGYEMRVGVISADWPIYYKNYMKNYLHKYEKYLLIHLLKSYELFANRLNVTSKFIPLSGKKTVNELIDFNALDIFISKINYYSTESILNMIPIKEYKTILFVPVITEKSLDVSNEILYSILSLSAIIILALICAYIFKFKKNEWSAFNVYSFLIGLGVDMEPRRSLRSIIMFFTLFIVSFFFCF